jgi:hypothetical protein
MSERIRIGPTVEDFLKDIAGHLDRIAGSLEKIERKMEDPKKR